MKNVNFKSLDAAPGDTDINSAAIDLSQAYKMSVQIVVGGSGSITGTMQLQVSNDPWDNGYQSFVPTNWTNLGSAVNIAAAPANYLISQIDVSYRWARLVYDRSADGGTATITAQVFLTCV